MMLRKEKIFRLGFALGCAFFAAGSSAWIYEARDQIFEWDWRSPEGKFERDVEPSLLLAAREYAEGQQPGKACVASAFGRDDHYLYLNLGCSTFAKGESSAQMIPTRARLSGEKISGLEQPTGKAYLNSLRRIFPLGVYEQARMGFSRQEFRRLGLQRAKEKGLSVDSAEN